MFRILALAALAAVAHGTINCNDGNATPPVALNLPCLIIHTIYMPASAGAKVKAKWGALTDQKGYEKSTDKVTYSEAGTDREFTFTGLKAALGQEKAKCLSILVPSLDYDGENAKNAVMGFSWCKALDGTVCNDVPGFSDKTQCESPVLCNQSTDPELWVHMAGSKARLCFSMQFAYISADGKDLKEAAGKAITYNGFYDDTKGSEAFVTIKGGKDMKFPINTTLTDTKDKCLSGPINEFEYNGKKIKGSMANYQVCDAVKEVPCNKSFDTSKCPALPFTCMNGASNSKTMDKAFRCMRFTFVSIPTTATKLKASEEGKATSVPAYYDEATSMIMYMSAAKERKLAAPKTVFDKLAEATCKVIELAEFTYETEKVKGAQLGFDFCASKQGTNCNSGSITKCSMLTTTTAKPTTKKPASSSSGAGLTILSTSAMFLAGAAILA